jgi:hypothetical protein
MAARGYMHKDPESSGPEAEATLPYAGPKVSVSTPEDPATRGGMQITLIWMLHFTVGFEATTVHIECARSP